MLKFQIYGCQVIHLSVKYLYWTQYLSLLCRSCNVIPKNWDCTVYITSWPKLFCVFDFACPGVFFCYSQTPLYVSIAVDSCSENTVEVTRKYQHIQYTISGQWGNWNSILKKQCIVFSIKNYNNKILFHHLLSLVLVLCVQVFQDTSWMAEAVRMDIDSVVFVLKSPGLPDRVPAKIRYKGPLKNKNGTFFGVELSAVSTF